MEDVAKRMVEKPKGLLAIDESAGTIKNRLEGVGLEDTEENIRDYRNMLASAPGLSNYISGAILFTETLFQENADGKRITKVLEEQGVLPGVKVDLGLEEQENGEKLTKGLEGLRERLDEYYTAGAKFAKWRAVIMIDKDKGFPTDENIKESMRRLAVYAKTCQEAGLVPIVEPEVLMDGNHTIEDDYEVTKKTLQELFRQLEEHGVNLKETVLKPNMIVSGKDNPEGKEPDLVAEMTIKLLKETVPPELPGITFLSGGIGDDEVTTYLSSMNKMDTELPWNLTFSFGRGLQRLPLAKFAEGVSMQECHDALLERSKASSDATSQS